MGDIDSVIGVHLVQLEQTIKDLKNKEITNWKCFFFCWSIWNKKKNLDFLRIFDPILDFIRF